MDPSAAFATYLNALSSALISSATISSDSLALMVSMEILLKSYLWQRDRMVIGILCASVVARINIT